MDSSPNRPAERRLARTVLDRNGRRWHIAETTSRTIDPSGSPCLVLSTDNRYVRLRRYPARWLGLSVEELLELAQAESGDANPSSRVERSRAST